MEPYVGVNKLCQASQTNFVVNKLCQASQTNFVLIKCGVCIDTLFKRVLTLFNISMIFVLETCPLWLVMCSTMVHTTSCRHVPLLVHFYLLFHFNKCWLYFIILYIWLFVYGDGDPNGAPFPSGAWVWGNFIPSHVNGDGDGMIGNRWGWGCCRYPHRGLSPLPSLLGGIW